MAHTVNNPGLQVTPMDADTKAAWVHALRSGRFTQTTGCLEDKHGNCCLGVLARVAGVPTLDDAGDVVFLFNDAEAADDSGAHDGTIPCGWRGISPASSAWLVHMNDYRAMSFDEIADWIDANL